MVLLLSTNPTLAADALPPESASLLATTDSIFTSGAGLSRVQKTLGAELYSIEQIRSESRKSADLQKLRPQWNDIYFDSALERSPRNPVDQGQPLSATDGSETNVELWQRRI